MRLYLDTSVLNFMFVTDAPEKREATEKLFTEIEAGIHEACISTTVVEELLEAQEPLRSQLTGLINKYSLEVLNVTDEAYQLASKYMDAELVSQKYADDATHLAVASLGGIECVVSWNFKHIVKPKARKIVTHINEQENYGELDIVSPFEVIDDGERED